MQPLWTREKGRGKADDLKGTLPVKKKNSGIYEFHNANTQMDKIILRQVSTIQLN